MGSENSRERKGTSCAKALRQVQDWHSSVVVPLQASEQKCKKEERMHPTLPGLTSNLFSRKRVTWMGDHRFLQGAD